MTIAVIHRLINGEVDYPPCDKRHEFIPGDKKIYPYLQWLLDKECCYSYQRMGLPGFSSAFPSSCALRKPRQPLHLIGRVCHSSLIK